MRIILSALSLLITTQLFCQKPNSSRSIYLEIGGSAGIGSFNYESIFREKGSVDLLWRIGVSGFSIDKNSGFVFVVPTTFGALIGKGNNKLEIGLGSGFSVTTKGRFFSLATPIIGYRYQNSEKRFFYRITYTPIVSYLLDYQYQHWGGISIGYNLN